MEIKEKDSPENQKISRRRANVQNLLGHFTQLEGLTNEIQANIRTKNRLFIVMASGILRFILILILVTFTIFSYMSKSGIMAKLDLMSSEPSGDKDSVNTSTSSTDNRALSDFGNLGSTGNINHIRNKQFSFSEIFRNKKPDKKSLDGKHITSRKPYKLNNQAHIRIPLAGAIYKPGHLENEIDVQRICPRDGFFTELLVLITSAINHRQARMAIRQTWMHYGSRRDVGMAFVLGHDKDNKQNKALDTEDYMYRDLIRGHFVDSYNNLTLKTMSLLEWAHRHCRRARYVLKTDDDMFVNVPKLLSFLHKLRANRTIYGRLADNWKPVRNKWSKYYISVAQYAEDVFPAFTTGPAYVLTGDIVNELLVNSFNTTFLKLEDVFITGIVAERLAIKRVNVRDITNVRKKLEACRIRDLITVHMVSPNEQFDVWKKLLDDSIKCYNGKGSK